MNHQPPRRVPIQDTPPTAARPFLGPPTPAIRSERAATVARWFGLTGRRVGDESALAPAPPIELPPPGTITLITGPSGAGKSTLLRDMVRSRDATFDTNRDATRDANRDARRRCIDVAAIALRDVPLVDGFGDDVPLTDALRLLSRVGLGEAWTYVRTPAELSDGQRWRARLAIALHRAARSRSETVLVADEFAAVLDRVTASVVARALRRTVDRAPGLSALAATSHADLVRALRPDAIVTCDFGRRQVEGCALG